jgi:co-chaperonin GroES (HSP10)
MEDATEKKARKFKVGDKVYAPFHGYGVVTKIHDHNCVYPIEVTWDSSAVEKREDVSTFTANGSLVQDTPSSIYTLTVVESAMPKDAEKDERMKTKFKVGDKVYSPHYGEGIVTEISDATNSPYPVEVHWTGAVPISSPECDYFECDYFTKEGRFQCSSADPEYDIVSLKGTKVSDDGVADRMMDALDKVEYSAVNPTHYQVSGIPEAIDIMQHLMTKEQMEGFLWGNIIKYAYRYGRKGDKAETAGKIAWYANKLKELEKGEHDET